MSFIKNVYCLLTFNVLFLGMGGIYRPSCNWGIKHFCAVLDKWRTYWCCEATSGNVHQLAATRLHVNKRFVITEFFTELTRDSAPIRWSCLVQVCTQQRVWATLASTPAGRFAIPASISSSSIETRPPAYHAEFLCSEVSG